MHLKQKTEGIIRCSCTCTTSKGKNNATFPFRSDYVLQTCKSAYGDLPVEGSFKL